MKQNDTHSFYNDLSPHILSRGNLFGMNSEIFRPEPLLSQAEWMTHLGIRLTAFLVFRCESIHPRNVENCEHVNPG